MVINLKKAYITYIPFLFIVILVSLILFSLSACSDTQKNYLTEKNSGDTLNLNIGDIIYLKLDSNITTGYSWELSEKTDSDIISLESSIYETEQQDEKIVGAGGSVTFSFKAISIGQTDLILEYLRPWEEDIEPMDIFILKIIVE